MQHCLYMPKPLKNMDIELSVNAGTRHNMQKMVIPFLILLRSAGFYELLKTVLAVDGHSQTVKRKDFLTMKKAIFIGLMTVSLTTQASWYFRGTPNDWAATAMETTDNINFCTQQSFANVSPRFKIDHYADWSENYP